MIGSISSLLISPTFQLLVLFSLLLVLVSCATKTPSGSPYKRWAAYYGSEAKAEDFAGYDLVVFDADKHPDIKAVQEQGIKVLAYISISEIDKNRSYLQDYIGSGGIEVGYNEKWQSYVVDLRQETWQNFVTREWLNDIMARGFDGVFVDTLDTAISYEKKAPEFSGMKSAAIHIIKSVRRHMPKNKLLMVNRGFEILPAVATDVDIILAESILVDADKSDHSLFPPHVYHHYVNKLQSLSQKYSHLSIFTLDYPAAIDKTSTLRIYNVHQKKGFIPYISTKNLQQLTPIF